MDLFSVGFQPFLLMFLSSLISFCGAWYWVSHKTAAEAKKQKAREDKELMSRLSELELQLKLVSQSVIPISTAFQAIIIKELTHPHAPEFDALLGKVGTLLPLNEDEQRRLSGFLRRRARDFGADVSESERDAANILPAVMRRALAEQAALALGHHIKVNRKLVSPGVGTVDVTTNHAVESADLNLDPFGR